MTELLQQAFQEANKLPPGDQDEFARQMLADLARASELLSPEQREEVERRLAANRADPENVIPWDVIRSEALARFQS